MAACPPDVTPYDALLLVSFGGPEGPDDVVPFLENVTRGRGIPRERLEEVGEHYFLFGGRSPINDQNRAFLAAIREDLAGAGLDLPVYWGNRNWDPYLADARRPQMRDDGVTAGRVLRDLAPTRRTPAAGSTARTSPPPPTRSRARPGSTGCAHYFNHPGFVEPVVDATLAALADLPDDARDGAHLVFVTHSIPTAMNERSGPWGGAYVGQHRRRASRGRRAGPPGDRPPAPVATWSTAPARARPGRPWLEPDVNDHLEELAKDGASRRGGRADRLRLRPHGGRLRPRHRGRRDRRAARRCR